MTTSLSQFYLDELHDWRSAVDLYVKEIDESEEWLELLIHLDSVPALAAKTEHHLNQSHLSKKNLLRLKSIILASEKKLHKEQVPVANDAITEEIKLHHKELRKKVHEAEKNYLDAKYKRDEFSANAVEIHNKIKSNG